MIACLSLHPAPPPGPQQWQRGCAHW